MAPSIAETSSHSDNSTEYAEGRRIPSVKQYGNDPVTIRLSDAELRSGETNPDTIEQLLTYYHRDGIVVLENAIPSHLVDKLYNKIVDDNATYLSNEFVQFNQGPATKNLSQVPPLDREYLSQEFYANKHAVRALTYLLGPAPELRFINSNVACPGATGRQAVHSDVDHDFPSIPFGIVLNIYLQDSDASNGVTEIWPGTHDAYTRDWQQATKDIGWITKEAIQKQGKIRGPVQPQIKKGSIVFRDLRLWHAGMPNTSDKHRIMLAVDYFAQWYSCPMPLHLPSYMKQEIEEKWGISTKGVEWVDGEVDHLHQPFYLNMTQDPERYVQHTEKGWEDWKTRKTGTRTFGKREVTEKNYWTPE